MVWKQQITGIKKQEKQETTETCEEIFLTTN